VGWLDRDRMVGNAISLPELTWGEN